MRLFPVLIFVAAQLNAQDITRTIWVDAVKREYIVHLPAHFDKAKKYPLVFVFHGGGGTAKNSISFFGMNAVADTAGFIIAYPNGLNKGWNDGRQYKKTYPRRHWIYPTTSSTTRKRLPH